MWIERPAFSNDTACEATEPMTDPCMYGRLMLTLGVFVDGGHGKPLIWHTDPDPSWVIIHFSSFLIISPCSHGPFKSHHKTLDWFWPFHSSFGEFSSLAFSASGEPGNHRAVDTWCRVVKRTLVALHPSERLSIVRMLQTKKKHVAKCRCQWHSNQQSQIHFLSLLVCPFQ